MGAPSSRHGRRDDQTERAAMARRRAARREEEARAAEVLRREGWPYSRIGRLLGVSGEAVKARLDDPSAAPGGNARPLAPAGPSGD